MKSAQELGVEEWRGSELIRLGFAAEELQALVGDGALSTRPDLHAIERALRAGCSHALAARIWSAD